MTDQFGEGMAHDAVILRDCYAYHSPTLPSPDPVPNGLYPSREQPWRCGKREPHQRHTWGSWAKDEWFRCDGSATDGREHDIAAAQDMAFVEDAQREVNAIVTDDGL